MAANSQKSLADKLGLKSDMNAAIIKAPAGYDRLVGEWPVGVSVSRALDEPMFDFIHYFAKSRSVLAAVVANLAAHLSKQGMLWVSWPKQSGGAKTDLDENVVRELGLKAGLVDVKVAAVDETWSALKFVYRVKDR